MGRVRVRLISGLPDRVEEWQSAKKELFDKHASERNKLVPNMDQPAENNTCECIVEDSKSPCLFSLADVDPTVSTQGFTVQQTMATQACYLPMLQPNYKCEEIHVLALLGSAKKCIFLNLIEYESESLTSRDSAGNTPLMLACCARKVSSSVINALLESSSQDLINAENHDGLTALHFAVLNNNRDLVKALLAYGADINAGIVEVDGNKYGLTPLMMSALCSPHSINVCLEDLLKHKPNLDVKTAHTNDRTCASLKFCIECDCGGCSSYEVISSRGMVPPSQVKTTNMNAMSGHAALHAVINSLDLHLRSFVAFNVKKPAREYYLDLFGPATEGWRLRVMNILLKLDPSIVNETVGRFRMHQNVTPLHKALLRSRCFEGDFTCAVCGKILLVGERRVTMWFDVLLDCPAIDVEARTARLQRTPLMLAAMNGHDYVIERLLDQGADLTAVDSNGHTPADLAVIHLKPDLCCKVLRVLFKTGVSHEIYIQPLDNSSLLKRVLDKEDTQVLNLFHQAGALSESNRLAMFRDTQTAPVEDGEQERRERFLQALKVASPRLLKQTALTFVSASAGTGPPHRRKQALRQTVQELMKTMSDTPHGQLFQRRAHKEDADKGPAEDEQMAHGNSKVPMETTLQEKHVQDTSQYCGCGQDRGAEEEGGKGSLADDSEEELHAMCNMIHDMWDLSLRKE